MCQDYNSYLLSVNSYEEHVFISDLLMNNDPYHHSRWYTSGADIDDDLWVWQDDENERITNGYFHWIPEEGATHYHVASEIPETIQEFESKRYLAYCFSNKSNEWGVAKVHFSEEMRYICEIPKSRLYQLYLKERDLDYGQMISDINLLPRGPYIIQEPESTIFDVNGRQRKNYVSLKCVAGGYPPPLYEWYKHQNNGVATYVDPLYDDNISVTDGTLMIFYPTTSYSGKYSCMASNIYGKVVSQIVTLTLEYVNDFPSWRSPDFGSEGWGKALACDYPHYQTVQHFNWVRDHFPSFVYQNQRVFISKDGGLYFSSLDKADSAEYACTISTSSSTGRIGPFFHLEVRPPSTGQHLVFANTFPKYFPSAPHIGDNVTLECMAFGYPTPTYSWRRNESASDLPKAAYTTNYGRVLVIPAMKIEDLGTYVCTARNDFDEIHRSVVLGTRTFPNFAMPLVNKLVHVDEVINWTCEAFGVPTVTYSWLKNGVELHTENMTGVDRDRYVIYQNTLTIRNVRERDEGIYQCKASNLVGDAYSAGELRVLKLAPSFQKYPLEMEIYAAEGDFLVIPCKPEAMPSPKITWKFGETSLNMAGRREKKKNGYLYINPVRAEDEGLYTCIAENQYGSSQSSTVLLVFSYPKMEEFPQPYVTVIINSSVEIRCRAYASSFLEVAYVWLYNGLRIDFAKNDQFSVGYHPGSLIISNVQLSNAGTYQCVVKTSIGQINASSEVTVVGPPGAPGGVYAEDMTARNGTISWIDGANNGDSITSYTIEGQTNHTLTWHVLAENTTNWRQTNIAYRREVSLYNVLSPGSRYKFRVTAINIFGKGRCSTPSPEVETLPYRPIVAPANVSGGGGKLGDLTITWDPLPREEWNSHKIWYKIYYKLADSKKEFYKKILDHLGNIGSYTVIVGEDNYYRQYTVKVQAINPYGAGPESQTVNIYSAEKAIQISPSNVKVLPFNSTALNVSWNPVELNKEGGIRGKLLGYRIKFWEVNEHEYNSLTLLNYGLTPWGIIYGLWPNTEYWVKVMAYNDAGSGIESERFLGRTYKKAPQRMPTNVKVRAVNPTTITVTWRGIITFSDEEPVEGYKIRYWDDGQHVKHAKDVIKLIGDDSKFEVTITDLVPAKTYQLRVLAFSAGGDGKMSYPALKFVLGDAEAAAYTGGTSSEVLSISVLLFGILVLYFS